MFYKDRHDKFNEITKLRHVVNRDVLREFQNLFAREQEEEKNLKTKFLI